MKTSFLILASTSVAIIALLYGISPDWFAYRFLGLEDIDPSLCHIFRATMGLYLALGGFWLISAFAPTAVKDTAILTTMVFAGGLFIGRAVSFIVDGRPAPLLMLYAAIELAFVPLAYWIYKRPD